MPSVVMATFSAYVPRLTMIVVPGRAASTAAWIDWPGLTMMTRVAPAGAAPPSTNALPIAAAPKTCSSLRFMESISAPLS